MEKVACQQTSMLIECKEAEEGRVNFTHLCNVFASTNMELNLHLNS